MATLTIKLKQHTPMWHFQSDQPGCALRATELKPKLDRFLIDRLKKEHKSVPDDYWVDPKRKDEKDFYALDYKVSIIPTGDVKSFNCFNKGRFGLFFANMGQEDGNQKFPIFYTNLLECRFFSLNEKLIELIEENVNAFFASTNFGMRQSKGFGCFLPENLTDLKGLGASYKFSIRVASTYTTKYGDKGDVRRPSGRYFQDLFQQLEAFYKILRGGMMQAYAVQTGIVWDKAVFKQMIHGEPIVSNGKYLCRDLLGLSSEISYIKGTDRGYKITKKSSGIERFKSPLTFKLVETQDYCFDVYIYISEIPSEMQSATFTATALNRGRVINTNDMTLYKPSIEEYMQFVYKHRGAVSQKSVESMFNTLTKTVI